MKHLPTGEEGSMKVTHVAFLGVGRVQAEATLEDGSKVTLFTFYEDEIRFDHSEIVGLTVREAKFLYHRKDVDYIKSA